MELRQDDIAEIVRIFNDSELQELRLDLGGNRLYLSKQAGGVAGWDAVPAGVAAAPAPVMAPPAAAASSRTGATPTPAPDAAAHAAPASVPDSNLVDLTSPLLGVFYRRPSPDKPAFVEVGNQVTADEPVCIIDVMKMFSKVPAGRAGRVVEILAQDGQLVEHGQVLMRLEPR